MGRALRVMLPGLAALLIGASAAMAQVGSTAQITGTVRDSSGAVLPGVDVAAIQTDTGFRRAAVTEASGLFVLSNLPVGPYRLEAMLSGFRSFQQTGIVLTVNANPEINITLSLGQVSETVSVQAAAPLVETRSPGIGQVIENERIEALPLNGRNPVDLITLAGAAVPQPALDATSRSMQGGRAIAVAGGQSFGIAYMLDGATHNNPYDNLNLPLPFPDALQEFRLETSSTTASNGVHSSASVNAVTKSGTNTFHGDLFEFVRNHRFNAVNRFNSSVDKTTRAACPVFLPDKCERQGDGLSRNQYGGTLGGPLKTDRLFFFGGYQGTRLRETPADLFAFVPTAAMLAGDFTQYASAQCNAAPVTLRGVFAGSGNQIAPSRLSPAALAIAKHLPTTTDPCGRVNYSRSRPQDEQQYIGKVDLQLTPNHSLFGRVIETRVKWTPPLQLQPENVLVSSQGGRDNKARSLTIGDTMVLTNNTVNAIRVAYNNTDIHRIHEPLGFSAPDVGVKMFSYIEDYLLVNVTGGGFQLGGGTESEARFTTPTYQVSDDLTLVRGAHQFGVGGNVSFWKSLSQANVRSPGQFTFNGTITGLPLADFLTGSLAQLIQATPNSLDMKQLYLGLYAQDTWKLSSKATVNYGVRWEPGLAQQIRNGAIYNFSVDRFLAGTRTTQYTNAPPGFLYPGDAGFTNDKAGMENHWNQWSPRVGVAWDPKGDGRMSIRTGYSLSFDFVNAQFHLNTSVAPPFNAEARVDNPAGGFDNPWLGTGNETFFPFTTGANSPFPLTGPYISIPSDINVPRQQSWNVSVQRQIGNDLAVSATYLGSYSDRLWNVRSLNPGVYIPGSCTLQTPTGPQAFNPCSTNATLNFRRALTMQNYTTGKYLGVVDEHTALGYQKYRGLLLSVQRRGSNGSFASANYTLSKCMGLPTQGGTTPNVGSGYVDPTNPDHDYGPCDTDRRHLVNLTLGVRTPDFRNAALHAVASDWTLSGIGRFFSGRPLNVTLTSDPARTGIANQRPNVVLDDPYGDKSYTKYLNRDAFAEPALGTLGNLQRNSIVGPGNKAVDLSLVRLFRIGTHAIEARAEAFNAFNWFNPGLINAPVTNLNSVQFGQITSADDPRIMQFALKYSF
ncbi:MAG TPA: carboxypeptidase-like regulatory domain-containing protein [Vicinamibacterales bacterium]|nr:carboxypeptidase-like regulatory domain-containing protein [Vicinamibacterales bacterium]